MRPVWFINPGWLLLLLAIAAAGLTLIEGRFRRYPVIHGFIADAFQWLTATIRATVRAIIVVWVTVWLLMSLGIVAVAAIEDPAKVKQQYGPNPKMKLRPISDTLDLSLGLPRPTARPIGLSCGLPEAF